ncbi:ribosome biogenesis GTPase YqeH [Bombilactobacillus thymidiniphilus]|uniref:Ribosome biogenesis GTPase YqeH n=1 Tax=Bombilactobacillus thymidiniphilus TaxID=2923363 RepID=A0ABY4PCE3_9LACO|nr:ribosome biogenesis GTPase YqeH [Bombilactobacillus thymidiniphilus]UQS83366.1 ribosome biogenesis GTPase YqeH [Bombilactobacillus thymidiniphilus]
MTEELYCIGCGALLQSTNSTQPGYVPASALQKFATADDHELYCQRCFRLRHYNEITPVSFADDFFQKLLKNIGREDALVVYVVDVFNFAGSVIPDLQKYIRHNPLLVVGNKTDLLPKSYKKTKVKTWLQQQVQQIGLKPLATTLVSAKKLTQVDELLRKIDSLRKGRNVYIIGATNVGKSTLINAIIKARSDFPALITTSNFPGTTLNEIHIGLDDGSDLIDTPGVIHDGQIANLLDPKELKYIAPQAEIHPRIFQLNPGQTLFLAGLGRLDFIAGEPGSFIAYVENNLYVHRTKLANADQFYRQHVGELLQPPHLNTDLPPLVGQEFNLTTKSDIIFSGLGWISVPANVQVKAYLPTGITLETRQALIN